MEGLSDIDSWLERIQEDIDDFFVEEDKKKSRRKQQISIKKAKFLTAIGKSTEMDDEQPDSNECNMSLIHMFRYTTNLTWKDSEVTYKFNLWKEPEFLLSTYTNCAEYILQTYLGRIDIDTDNIFKAMVYVMAHARDFADPRKRLIQFSEEGTSDELKAPSLPVLIMTLPKTPYNDAISECLTQLRSGSDNEETYQRLNANITFLILLMVRRTVKTEQEFLKSLTRPETQESYIKLCPHSVHTKLPIICEKLNIELRKMFKDSAMIYLVMTALLQCNNERTKHILNVTCLQHLEWTGLVFPKLFFKVANFYNVSESDFWDLLCTDKTFDSLSELSDVYYKQYKNTKEDPSVTYKLFPYGRAVNIEFDTELSPRNHADICYTLAYLHDLHFGLDKSFARKAHWAKAIKGNSPEDELALSIYNKLKNIPCTSTMSFLH